MRIHAKSKLYHLGDGLGRLPLSPLRGFCFVPLLPTPYGVGFILALLRSFASSGVSRGMSAA